MRIICERCWEFMCCDVKETCTAYPEHDLECWLYAGTMRNTAVEQRMNEFKQQAIDSGQSLTEEQLIQFRGMQPKLCKYIATYGTCHCCPYYLYMEKKKKEMPGGKNIQW